MAVLVLFLPADPAERAARYVIVQEGVSIASGTVRPGEEPASPAGVRLDRALVLLPSEQVPFQTREKQLSHLLGSYHCHRHPVIL